MDFINQYFAEAKEIIDKIESTLSLQEEHMAEFCWLHLEMIIEEEKLSMLRRLWLGGELKE